MQAAAEMHSEPVQTGRSPGHWHRGVHFIGHSGSMLSPIAERCTGFLRERKALCTVVTVTVLFKSNAFEILFIPFAGKAQIVRKEKKQKQKFSEPDFLRS